MLAMAKPPSFSDLRSLASLAEQREDEPSGGGASMQDAVFGRPPMQDAVFGRTGVPQQLQQQLQQQPQPQPSSAAQFQQPKGLPSQVEIVDDAMKEGADESKESGEAARRRGRAALTQEERRERRLLSNRLAAKRSYYRRQNRQTNIKQAIDQIQTELKNARSKVAIFRQLLREGGLDPEAILANANVVAVNSLPSHAQQRMQPLQQTLQQPMQQTLQPPPQQAGTAGMISKHHRGDGGNVTPPNTLALSDPAPAHMLSPMLVVPGRDSCT